MHIFLVLELCLSLESVVLGIKDFLFIEFGSNIGSIIKIFNNNLSKIIKCYKKNVSRYINTSRRNPNGIRKDSSTYAISRTTLIPSLISIAQRGEW